MAAIDATAVAPSANSPAHAEVVFRLFRAGEEWHLFVIEGGRARERKVGAGQRNATQAQLVDGVKAGEVVVRFPGNALSDGVRVEARDGKGNF